MADGRRIAFVCDVHADFAVGGAQRFYQTLSRELARQDAVTYLTKRFWEGPATRQEAGVEEVGLTREPVAGSGGRGVAPKLTFALALLWHLARHGGRYRVVHVCCFPHVALIAARIGLLPHRGTMLVADWHEVLPRATWRRRLGRVGDLGWIAQRAAIGAGHAAITFSKMHEARLRREGRREGIHLIPEFPTEEVRVAAADRAAQDDAAREPVIVFAGRLVAEKRPHLLPAVLAELRREDPAWRAEIFGTGPERDRVQAEAQRLGVADAVRFAGFADWSELSATMLRARALVLPTEREGFGLVVLEAAGHGLPSVLVAEEDNAAVELIADGQNGRVCATADAAEQARAVLALVADEQIHARTRAWFAEHRQRYSVESCAAEIREVHRVAPPR